MVGSPTLELDMPRVCLSLLGGFQARLEPGLPISLPVKKAQALLAYLAVPVGQAHPRDKLATLLWGEMEDEQARGNLRQALSALRKALPDATLVIQGEGLALDGAAIEVDVAAFERRVAEGTPGALAQAAALYQGDLLAGLAVKAAGFEEWLMAERERLRELALEGLAKLLARQRTAGATEDAIHSALKLLALDPLQEPAHRTLMRLYAQAGRRGAALRQYQQCVGLLQRELAVEPEPETRQLYQEILNQRPSRSGPSETTAGGAATPPTWTGRLRSAAPVAESPLVGRQPELACLRAALEDVWSGRGRAVVIRGEAGVGKTRLVEELAARAGQRGGRILSGRAYESERILPFGLWVDAVRGGGRLDAPTMLDGLGAAWRAELTRLFPELGGPAARPPGEAADERRLFEAVTQLVTHLATRQPLVLLLEDLHWADEPSLRLLAFLGRRSHEASVLVVATIREEELAPSRLLRQVLEELRGDQRLAELTLSPLARPDTLALVRALVPAGVEGPALARLGEQVWAFSEGNPFMAVETVRALREGTSLQAPSVLPVPARVREVIVRRLERLSPRARDLVRVAAVVGREFDFALLQGAAGLGEREAAEGVEELVRRRVLGGAGERFDFTHDRIREVAHDELLPLRRRLLHGRVARALEELFGENLEPHYGALVVHYRGAEISEKAVEYLSRFADTAARRHAHAEAITALQEALTRMERLGGGPERLGSLVDLALRQVPSLNFLGRFQESLDLLLAQQERVERCQDPAVEGRYYFWLARTQSLIGDHEPSGVNARRAVAQARRCGDRTTIGRASYLLAMESFWLGEFSRGLDHGLESVSLLADTDDRWWLGLAHWIVGVHHAFLGNFDRAFLAERQASALGDAIDDPRLQSSTRWATGYMHILTGDWEAGIAACAEGLDRARDPVNTATALGFLGMGHLEKGDFAEAIRLLEESVRLLDSLRYRQVQGWFTAGMAEACLDQGQIGAARAHAIRALEITRDSGFRYGVAYARRALGCVAGAAGAGEEAARQLDEALQAFESMQTRLEIGRTRLAKAELAHARGDRVRSAVHLDEARRLFEALGLPRQAERSRDLARRLGVPLAQ